MKNNCLHCNFESFVAILAFIQPDLRPFKLLFVLRLGGGGHFRSRDKDGGHTIRSAIVENPTLDANIMALSFTEPALLLINVQKLSFYNHCVMATVTVT